MIYKKEIAGVIAILMLMACSHSLWDSLPGPIGTFISTYYPLSNISSYDENNGTYYVTIKNGATITFDSDYQWTYINGNGEKLPQIFVEDKLEPKLVQYLMETESVGEVFAAHNDPREVILDMLDYKIRYIKESGEIMEIRE
ncbi:MAG: hypothetical protein K1V87_06590 [Muribaculum sp.]